MRAHVAAILLLLLKLHVCNATQVFFQDAGARGEDTSIISGVTNRHGSSSQPEISNTTIPQQVHYRTHRWGSNFTYTISGLSSEAPYTVNVGFSEVWEPNCNMGKRKMNVLVNDVVVREDLDVYANVGCQTALTETFATTATSSGKIKVGFIAKKDNAMVSAIEVVELEVAGGGIGDTAEEHQQEDHNDSDDEDSEGEESEEDSDTDDDGSDEKSWKDMHEDENYVARHECSFVQAGTKFYMFGGREQPWRLDKYDYTTNTWSRGANVPQTLNHFQATEYHGLVWVVGAFKDNRFPIEKPAARVYIYDPANDAWMQGPQIPEDRQRGGGGLVVHDGKFYLVGGNSNGHSNPVSWMDEYDPRTASWRQLPDAPHARDHFHAVVVVDRLYAAGGRRTTKTDTFSDTIPKVDVYDFASGEWLNSNLPDDLPIPRAGAATAVMDGRVVIMGGESGIQEEAHNEVHALNTKTGKWSALAYMNHGRHGTQAIVSGNGVCVTGGSPIQGGGNQRNMEVYGEGTPMGEEGTKGVLSAPSSVEIVAGEPKVLSIQHISGNQGVFVNLVQLEGDASSDFRVASNAAGRHLIGRGEQHDVLITYTGTTDGAKAELILAYSKNDVLRIELVAKMPTETTTTTTTTTPAEEVTSTRVQDTTSTLPSTQVQTRRVFFANTGVPGEDMSIISGDVKRWGTAVSIVGADTPNLFQTHRYGRNFMYKVGKLTPGNAYRVSLGFAEIYEPNCKPPQKRLFHILINGVLVKSDLDVFAEAGCFTAHVEQFDVSSNDGGAIEIGFEQSLENAMVSFIEVNETVVIEQSATQGTASTGTSEVTIRTTTTKTTSALLDASTTTDAADEETMTTTTPPPPPRELVINAGKQREDTSLISGKTRLYEKSDIIIQQDDTTTIDPSIFQSHRWGANFTYTLNDFAPLQRVQVTLGFAETYEANCRKNKRLFDIVVNGEIQISQLDVFVKANGCSTPHLEMFIATATADGSVHITFLKRKDNAMVSYIQATTAI